MNPYSQLLAFLSSSTTPLFCTEAELTNALLSVVHLLPGQNITIDIPTYQVRVATEIKPLQALSQQQNINLTRDFDSEDVASNSLAYHRIDGLIMADSRWYFSTRQFEKDILAAESNPNINAHFLHVKSGGGEAWYLDQVSRTLSSLSKPIYTYVEKVCASAAYYIGCHGAVIKSMTQNDTIGSIGTMIDGLDFMAIYEKMGAKRIRAFATDSKLKNKMSEDLREGKPEQIIRDVLDPMQAQFAATVRSARPVLASLDATDPIFQGESFMATMAIGNRLIDGICSIEQSIGEAHQLGLNYTTQNSLLSHI